MVKSDFSLAKDTMVMTIEDWEIRYISFIKIDNILRNTVVILGEIFQTFSSFQQEIKHLSREYPLYIVEFSRRDRPKPGFEDYTRPLRRWMDQLGLEKITPIGLNYSSMIGYYFASLYPQRTYKLVLGAMSLLADPSLHAHLKRNLAALEEGDWERFARQEKIPPDANDVQMVVEEKERLHYIQYAQRLLNLKGLPRSPSCDTLALVGEFDPVVTPDQYGRIGKIIRRGHFAIVEGIGHLTCHHKRRLIGRLCRRFLNGQPLNRMKDIVLWNRRKSVSVTTTPTK